MLLRGLPAAAILLNQNVSSCGGPFVSVLVLPPASARPALPIEGLLLRHSLDNIVYVL